MSALLLFALVACDNNTELDKPTPPPTPLEVTSGVPAQVKVSGTLEVVAIKNGSAPVTGTLTLSDGELALRDRDAWSGASGKVEIALTSYDSKLELRDTRIKNTLLGVATAPTAAFELTGVSGLPADGIPVGQSGNGALAGQITLAGISQPIQVPVAITRTAEESWTVKTTEQVVLSLRGFGLEQETEALETECAHESIDDQVKVGFSVVAAAAPPAPSGEPPASP